MKLPELDAERFVREIAITAQLDHPPILPLLDRGAAGEPLSQVMPFVAGESLRDLAPVPVRGPGPIRHPIRDASGRCFPSPALASYAGGNGSRYVERTDD